MDTEAFISAIQERPAIWMSTHPQHKYKNAVKRLWNDIQLVFPDYSGDDLRKKWKSLKDTYRKELKKNPIPRPGEAAVDVAVKWKYYKLLTFLRDELIPTVNDNNLEAQEDNSTHDSLTDSEIGPTDASTTKSKFECHDVPLFSYSNVLETIKQSPPHCQTTTAEDEPAHSPVSPTVPTSPPSSTALSARKRQTPNELRAEYLEIEKKKLRMLELEMSKSNSQPENQSEDYHFLMSILPQMERLPSIQKLRLRNKINQALMEEMEMLSYREQGFGNFGHGN